MEEFLKNKKTGQVVRKNIYNSRDPDMVPCIAPWERPAIFGQQEITPIPKIEQPAGDNGLLDKDIAEDLVLELFGKSVGDVKKEEMLQFALDFGAKVSVRNTKLEIITAIHNTRSPETAENKE